MINPVDHVTALNEPQNYYTASMSPYMQGAELTHVWQLTNYINVKVRSNTSLAQAVRGTIPGYASIVRTISSFDDTLSQDNYGVGDFYIVKNYTIGRSPESGKTGTSRYITYITSGSQGFVASGSTRAAANLFTRGRLDTYISHQIENRDLGQSNDYDNALAFEEPDCVERHPDILVNKHPDSVILPTAGVLANIPANRDGVIEPLTIRAVVDHSSIELPFVARSVKGSLQISDEKHRSFLFDDAYDIRQTSGDFNCAPFFDCVSSFGYAPSLIDQPGAFSDEVEKLAPFTDSTMVEVNYANASFDGELISLFVSGVLSGTTRHFMPDNNLQSKNMIAACHGFTFSQKDNFRYDSIAFGGLLR